MSQMPPDPPPWQPQSVPPAERSKPTWWKPRRSWKWWTVTSIAAFVVLSVIVAIAAPPSKPAVANVLAPSATAASTVRPTVLPVTGAPTVVPETAAPTVAPTPQPTARPTARPTSAPTPRPTVATSGCYIDPEGKCYRPGEYCPDSFHGQTVQGQYGPITCEDKNGWRWVST